MVGSFFIIYMEVIPRPYKNIVQILLSLFYFFLISGSLFAGDDGAEIEAWEPEDIESYTTIDEQEYVPLLKSIGMSFIRIYQKKISVRSIHRCPLYLLFPVCPGSHYTARVIHRCIAVY